MFPSAHLIILGSEVIQLPLGLVSGWWGLMNIEYDNPTCHSGRNPSDLMVCCSWMAQEVICGKQSHNNPWQRTIMLWRPESPMPISSLLFIRMARPPSPGQPAYYYSLKQQEVAIVYLELVFFRLVLSVATLQKAERKKNIYASLNVSFPWTLAVQVSGIFQSAGPSVFSSLIGQLIGLPFSTLQKVFAVSETLLKSKITRPKSIHFKRNYKLSSFLSQQDSTKRWDGKGCGTLLKD